MKMVSLALVLVSFSAWAKPPIQPMDVFQLEYASDPRISADGRQLVYTRNFMDVMKDRQRSNLWVINTDGSSHRPLTTGSRNDRNPLWSPDGNKLLYVSSVDGSNQLYMRWMDTGQTARLAQLTQSPGSIAWSPDGRWIAFTMRIPAKGNNFISPPPIPAGAEWGRQPWVVDRTIYRQDGGGYVSPGYQQIFLLPAEGGSPRQLSSDPYNHGGTPSWTADSKALIFSANRSENADYEPVNSELYRLDIATGEITALTGRDGPDTQPVVSPNGERLAWLGFDDEKLGYQITRLYVGDIDGENARSISDDLDRGINAMQWAADGRSLYISYDDGGNTRLARISLNGNITNLADNLGGLSLGRPYSSSAFSVADNGRYVFTQTGPLQPADLVTGRNGGQERRLTRLNDDLFSMRSLSETEEIHYTSSIDGREIEGWIVKPPNFDPNKKYPLVLEIHGGPFSNYGNRFSMEVQLYAAAGNVVLFTNPRGSTSYGKEFGNLIHHNYPSQDYDDLMSGVDAVIEKGYIDEDQLYVTGGSGGGTLTAWIIGKTDRFRAAVVAKPVINWTSFVLTSDFYPFFTQYWFPAMPWEAAEHYWARSPLSLVGNVTTPTMLMTGEADYRTPISETEQYYQALKLRKIDTLMVRIPDTPHGIAASRPSNLMAKAAYILKWFEDHSKED